MNKPLTTLIITLSDRAYNGQYEDRSGPLLETWLNNYKKISFVIKKIILPDNQPQLEEILKQAIADKTDIIFTTGGTGVGPADITPESVLKISDKVIPGIMENIRIKSAILNPLALLSRSVATVSQKTQIYTLPGSPKAIDEYLSEICKTIEHLWFMLNGIDNH